MKPIHNLSKGDLVLVVNAGYFEEWNGTIATVQTGYKFFPQTICLHTMKRSDIWGYSIQLGDGRRVRAQSHQIIPIPNNADSKRKERKSAVTPYKKATKRRCLRVPEES